MTSLTQEPGGFLPNALPSPVPSTAFTQRSTLPQPRSHPLRAGSTKEEIARRYVDGKLMYISRRYTKKYQPPEPEDEVIGYRHIRDVCKDLGEVVDVLWLSGTPSLQIPYLLNIALALSTYLSAFPPDPNPTFSLLRKLDYAFASLLQGQDADSGDLLPGFQGKRGGLTRTDMVRCKSLVEGMRVLIVEVMSKEFDMHDQEATDTEMNEQTGTDTEMDSTYGTNESEWNDHERGHDMDVAKVFEKTIVQLGESLKGRTGYDVGG